MSLEQIGSLIALALVDSTGFGTLLIPLLLVLATRRVDWPAMGVCPGTVLASSSASSSCSGSTRHGQRWTG